MKLYEILLQGGPVMWPLLMSSLLALTVVFERVFFWGRLERRRNRPLMDEILHLAEQEEWELIGTKCRNSRDHVIRVLAVGILHRDFDMGKAMQAEAEQMVQRMNRFMAVLDTTITVAPLLGILGTVLGIIDSFEMLGDSGIADPKMVTAGIAQALITTATGLAIAIGTVLPFNFFQTRIDRAVHVMEKYASSLEAVYAGLETTRSRAYEN